MHIIANVVAMARAALFFVIICVFKIVWSAEFNRRQGFEKIYKNTKASIEQHQQSYRNVNAQHNVGSLFNLYDMIGCATTCDPWDLNNYGNYCGLGGSGVPIDDIDSCCEQHDVCYDENVELYRCTSGDVYAWAYTWTCNKGYPICNSGFDKCGFWTCVCDKAFVECVKDAGCPKN